MKEKIEINKIDRQIGEENSLLYVDSKINLIEGNIEVGIPYDPSFLLFCEDKFEGINVR